MKNLQIIQTIEIEKNKFLDEKYLDWYVETYIRNYPEFLELDYKNAMKQAKQVFDDYEVLTKYIVDLNNAYISAKSYLCID
jgi:cytoskeletal protein RodZ